MTVEKLCLKADVQLALKQRAENICQEIETREQIVKAFVSTIGLRERLDAQLEMLEQKYGSGAELPSLWGTTIGVKDVFFTDTLATRAGSWLPTDAIKGERSIVVSQLLNAGAILLGKTACSEFGYQKAANTSNPLYPHYSPGGSSSGSAAAVAAGFCDLGVGSQSRAGVTLPAAFCGVNGFTASAGRISKQGMFHLSQSLEQIGLFAKDIKVIKHAAKVLLLKGATTPEAALDMRFGIPSRSFLALAEPQIIAQFDANIRNLQNNGIKVVETDIFEDYKELFSCHSDLFAAEFTQNHISLYREYQPLYSPTARALFERGLEIPPENLYLAADLQISMQESFTAKLLEYGISALISPSTTGFPNLMGTESANPAMSVPFSFCGLPSLCVALGNNIQEMPSSILISSQWGADEYLLEKAAPALKAALQSQTILPEL